MKDSPLSVTVRAYNVGFGDCILLSFDYGKEERHALIDFGSSSLPGSKELKRPLMQEVAQDVARVCGGKLQLLVASHRHSDHISGFATASPTAKRKSPGDLIAGLDPEVVVQPWTEAPDAANPKGLSKERRKRHQLHLESLAELPALSTALLGEARRLHEAGAMSAASYRQLAFIGEANILNHSAVVNLMALGKRHRAEYVSHGSKLDLQDELPGVKVHVLGPPTCDQSAEVAKQRDTDPAEYWHLLAGSARATRPGCNRLFPGAPLAPLKDERWFVRHLDSSRSRELLEIVRALDDAMNNTSVILLFEVGSQKLLFPGDAQIENWQYALFEAPDAAATRALLEGVTLYKVGHHGSLNGTPKTLWGLMTRPAPGVKKRLDTILSTKPGKHGSSRTGTEVPRAPLVEALERDSTLRDTRDVKVTKSRPASALCLKLTLDCSAPAVPL